MFLNNPLTACPSASTSETITTASVAPTTVGAIPGTSAQAYLAQQQVTCPSQVQTPCSHVVSAAPPIQPAHHCQSSCTQHQQLPSTHQQTISHQVQAATQTQAAGETKKLAKTADGMKVKKGRVVRHQNQNLQGNNFQQNQNYQVGPNNAGMKRNKLFAFSIFFIWSEVTFMIFKVLIFQ